jgi:transcriptional regulator with PAS, ATPase and Fis domain
LPETLLESELFGHRRGAFTGAIADKKGLFQEADGGTLFLDEVGAMSGLLQTRLLRVLQEREVRRVGDNTPIYVNVRVVAAANEPLEKKIKEGTFREDLYYRLNVIPIQLPSLRERRDDIPLLVAHFSRTR